MGDCELLTVVSWHQRSQGTGLRVQKNYSMSGPSIQPSSQASQFLLGQVGIALYPFKFQNNLPPMFTKCKARCSIFPQGHLFQARNYPFTNVCGGNSYLGNWVPNKKWLALQTTSWKWTTWPPYSACKKENTTSVAAIINVESHRRLSSVRTTKQMPGQLAPACCSCLPSWSEGVWWVTTVNYVLSPENNLGVL